MPHTVSRRLDPALLARRWAIVALGATVASGAWLRAAMLWPSVGAGANLVYGVHAHSHVAFFGWVVLAVASVSARHVAWSDPQARRWRMVVHALGVLSLVALVAFLRMGYAAPTIALSAAHVALWFPLARLAWPMDRADDETRAWMRAAWVALLASGFATLIPGLFAARGIREGWWREFGIKLFLALFINGFAGLAAMGLLLNGDAAPASARRDRVGAWLRRAIAAALLPLAVLYVSTAPPVVWLTVMARVAVGIVGVCTLAVTVQSWRQSPWQSRSAWEQVAMGALGATGVLQCVAATGVGASLMYARPITIAFTHLMLLLAITPILASALLTPFAPRWRPLAASTTAAVMCLALAAVGWPWLGGRLATAGLGPLRALTLAGIAGIATAAILFTLLPLLFGARAPEASR